MNHRRRTNVYTQSLQFDARVWLIAGLPSSCCLESALTAPGEQEVKMLSPETVEDCDRATSSQRGEPIEPELDLEEKWIQYALYLDPESVVPIELMTVLLQKDLQKEATEKDKKQAYRVSQRLKDLGLLREVVYRLTSREDLKGLAFRRQVPRKDQVNNKDTILSELAKRLSKYCLSLR